MEQHGLVPDVLSKVPEGVIKINYNGLDVNLGNVLTPTQVKEIPEVHWPADSHQFYTLLFTDPDAPSRAEPTLGEVRHWLVVNIPGSDVAKGETLSPFFGSGPPKGTGLHRYVFLVYRQPGKLEFDKQNTSVKHRTNFSSREFTTKYNLEVVAGNFYQAEYDSYCDVLHRQLKTM